MFGCLTTATFRINEKNANYYSSVLSEMRVSISDTKKSRKGIVMFLLKNSSVLSEGAFARCF